VVEAKAHLEKVGRGVKVASEEKEVIEDKELAEKAGGASSRLRRRAARKSRLAIESTVV
jgi:hypothetical protein